MADPEPGPSHETQAPIQTLGPPALRVIRRVATKLNNAINTGNNLSALLENEYKPYVFTGIQPSILENFEIAGESDFQVFTIDRSVIYNQLVDFYLVSKTMPTSYQLFVALKNETPVYMDIAEFRKLLVKYGFMWKHMKYNLFVVIEKPEVIFERYFYLSKIVRYRAEQKNVYYIDENVLDEKGYYYSVKQSKSIQSKGLLHKAIYAVSVEGVECLQFTDSFCSESLFKFIKEHLIFVLKGPSVVVLNNSKHHREEIVELPTPESCRKNMMDWLDYFNVPYDAEMTKPLLYDLVEKCTDHTQKLYKVDELLKAHGHTVLRLPKCIRKLTPATQVFDIIKTNLLFVLHKEVNGKKIPICRNVFDKFHVIIESIKDIAPQLMELITSEEKDILDKDMKVDACIDDLQIKCIFCLRNKNNPDSANSLKYNRKSRILSKDPVKKTPVVVENPTLQIDNEYDSEIPSCDSDSD